VVEVTSFSTTREMAIEEALIDAISQVKGVDIDSHSMRLANQIKDNGRSNIKLSIANTTAMKTKGQIKHYQILDENCDAECSVTLSVTVPVYDAPGLSPDRRRTMVIAPFEGEYGQAFSDNLQTFLTQSRRFAILDREHNKEYQNEAHLLLSANTALTEKMRLGQVLGLDYLIVGSVGYRDDSRTNNSNMTGESEFILDQASSISYKIINLATRQIKWQDNQEIQAHIQDPTTAQQVATQITNLIYPIKIVANNDQHVVLNQGGKSIEKGQIYDVYQLGDKIIDPYTKESLGREENHVGRVEISRITPKLSYAKAIGGNIQSMSKGSILRRAEMTMFSPSLSTDKTSANNHSDNGVKTSPSGGVIIPTPQKNTPTPSPKGGVILDY